MGKFDIAPVDVDMRRVFAVQLVDAVRRIGIQDNNYVTFGIAYAKQLQCEVDVISPASRRNQSIVHRLRLAQSKDSHGHRATTENRFELAVALAIRHDSLAQRNGLQAGRLRFQTRSLRPELRLQLPGKWRLGSGKLLAYYLVFLF